MTGKTLMMNKNVHSKLEAIAKKRKAEGNPINTMAGIVHELVLKQHKKECGK